VCILTSDRQGLFRRIRRALLPNLIKFAYIPENELRIDKDAPKRRENTPDFLTFGLSTPSFEPEQEHILVLEFVDDPKGKKSSNQRSVSGIPSIYHNIPRYK
jgi:DEAD/DEAH box helicase domain-containing protein